MTIVYRTTREGSLELIPQEEPTAVTAAPSFESFVRDRLPGLVRYAAMLSGSVSQGEDLVQEVLLKMHPRWPRLVADGTDPIGYVRRAVTNEFLSWRRRWSTQHIRATDPLPDRADRSLAEAESDPRLWKLLQELPRQQRAAVVLRYYQDLEHEQIAAAMHCRPSTVRTHLARALTTLRGRLGAPAVPETNTPTGEELE